MRRSSLPPAERAAFLAELTRLNLRHMFWLAVAGNLFLWLIFIFVALFPLPAKDEVNFLNGALCANGLLTLLCLWRIRGHPAGAVWPRVLVLENAVALLGLMNAYYFAMLPAYGSTSVYVIGVLVTAAAFRLPPPVLWSLLVVNHAAFLTVLFTSDLPLPITVSAATDFSGVVVLGGVIGYLLYRAQLENFLHERTISERNRELERLRQIDRDESAAARLAEEKARLEVLRYQLNPHFLFNALTSVCSQLPPALASARATIERLTDFCQLTLFRPPDGAHPRLGDEIKLLRAYLDIEQTRWEELLSVDIDVDARMAEVRIPSLLLLPLVENALKYGRATNSGALAIRIRALSIPAGLEIEVANTGEWVDSEATNPSVPSLGIGLENLRQRLARHYPGRHVFSTTASTGWVVARLRLSGSCS